jgi:hypothetical protein
MDMLAQLWLPILVSAVAVFVASSIAWMVLPHHRADIQKLPDEPATVTAVTRFGIPPGFYMWPNCATPEEMKSQEYKDRYAKGPWGTLTIIGARPNFGLNLTVLFLVYLIISVATAFVTGAASPPGASFGDVFPVAAVMAVTAYTMGAIPGGIMTGRPRRFLVTDFVDCVVYGLLTAAIFGLMWPGA